MGSFFASVDLIPKKLSFKTSAKGEDVSSEVVFDVEAARAILDDENDHRSAAEVIDAISTVEIHEEEADKHYFIVTLEDVRPDYPELLDEIAITEYLKEVAPIDYSLPFKNQLIATNSKDEFRELHSQVGHFRLSVNNETNIHKRYGLKIDGTGDDIESLEYFKIEDDKYGLLAWGWFAVTAFSKAIPPLDKNRGIRLRKHNILIGAPDLLNQYFKESRGNNYFYGEIHAIHPKLKPESSRSGLAPTPEAECLKQHLRDFFARLHSTYHIANDAKNAVRDMVAAEVEKDETPKHEDLHKVKEQQAKAYEKLQKTFIKASDDDVHKKVVEIHLKKVAAAHSQVAVTSMEIAENSEGSNTEVCVDAAPKKSAFDRLSVLKLKYSNKEITLIQKILKSFTDNCPIGQKELIEQIKNQVIKDLGK
jgi:molecular chaperone HtpG